MKLYLRVGYFWGGILDPKKVQVYQVRSLDRPLFIVFVQNSEGFIRYIANKGTGVMEFAVSFITVLRVRDQEESTLS